MITSLALTPDLSRVEIPALVLDVQHSPISAAAAMSAADDRGRYVAVIEVPFGAYLRGAGRPSVLGRYLGRQVIAEHETIEVSGPLTHRVVAVVGSPTEADGQIAYLEVTYDLSDLIAVPYPVPAPVPDLVVHPVPSGVGSRVGGEASRVAA